MCVCMCVCVCVCVCVQGQGQGYIGQEQRMHAGRHAPEHRRQYADDSDENEDIEVSV